MRHIAIDWSGAASGERAKIWTAEVRGGHLVRLEAGRSREEVVAHLVHEARLDPELVVGLDFAFSFPAWFCAELETTIVDEVWARVRESGEVWLADCVHPFWGRPGTKKPELPEHLRRTEHEAAKVSGAQPKSVFQVGGAGAVGTGSLRGMPHLTTLRQAGLSVWPFHPAGPSTVVEIFPRLLTGAVVKSDPAARDSYLDANVPEIPAALRGLAASSEDAFDAAVSAVVMARNAEDLRDLRPARDATIRLEGAIWWTATGR